MGKRTAIQVSDAVVLEAAKYREGELKLEFCNVPDCDRTTYSANLCCSHYMQRVRYLQKLHPVKRPRFDWRELETYLQPRKGLWGIKPSELHCHVPDCNKKYLSRGLCTMHYSRWYKGKKKSDGR